MEEVQKSCPNCGAVNNVSEFGNRQYSNDGLSYECRVCVNIRSANYKKTIKGHLQALLDNAKKSAKHRQENNRVEAGKIDIDISDLEGLYKNQKGLCYYSGIVMNSDRNDFKMSLERLNPDLGYIKGNIALTCIEFNNISQWTHEKINEMLHILKQNITDNPANFEVNTEQRNKQTVVYSTIDGIEYAQCTWCNINKTLDTFTTNVYRGCYECRKIKVQIANSSPRGTLLQLFHSAKGHTKRREGTKNTARDNSFDIDLNVLIDKYNEQKGLCAYSGIPLRFGHHLENNWKVSLERIDVFKGYVKDNICLICLEFQAADKSVIYKDNTLGNSGWTKDKFQYFLTKVQEKYANENKAEV